jgi:hypothetical protein
MHCKAIFVLALIFGAVPAIAAQGIHIDAASEDAANRSYQRMVKSLDGSKRDELVTAVLQLNMVGVETASDAPANPSAGRIRDRIGGMTAAQIVDLAHRTATNTTVTVKRMPQTPTTVPGGH